MVGAASSCTDLDTPINVYYEQFPNSEIATAGDFNTCYYYIRNEAWLGRNFWETVFMLGDEAMGVNFAGNYFDNGRYFFCSVHNMRPDHYSGGQESDLLSGITYTNTVIRQYGGADGTDPIVAPLRVIRAFYTFLFMDMYGDTPIMDHVAAEDEVFDRMPRAQVAEFIEKELLECIPDMSEKTDLTTYGTPNKWMAETLLAKLYLNWGVYTNDIKTVTNNTPNPKLNECVKWCDEIINSGLFEVGDGYRKKFFPDNGVQIKDFIYAIPMDPWTYGNGYWGGWQPNRFFDYRASGNMTVGTFTWKPYEVPAGVFVLIPECVDRFCLEGDERNDMIAVGQHYAYDPYTFEKTDVAIKVRSGRSNIDLVYTKDIEWADISTGDVGSESVATNLMKGARLYKYTPNEEDYSGIWDKKGLQGNDIPVFRYADVLMMKAECILRGATATNGDNVASLVNQIRDCAHAPRVTGSMTLDELLDERGREFVMEMWRRNDLIRFGKFEDDWGWKNQINPDAKTNLGLRLMPLANTTLGVNTNWTQNEGY